MDLFFCLLTREVHERVNITNYPNGTMSFQQKRMWYFDEERTNGTLDDIITSLNVPLVVIHNNE